MDVHSDRLVPHFRFATKVHVCLQPCQQKPLERGFAAFIPSLNLHRALLDYRVHSVHAIKNLVVS